MFELALNKRWRETSFSNSQYFVFDLEIYTKRDELYTAENTHIGARMRGAD